MLDLLNISNAFYGCYSRPVQSVRLDPCSLNNCGLLSQKHEATESVRMSRDRTRGSMSSRMQRTRRCWRAADEVSRTPKDGDYQYTSPFNKIGMRVYMIRRTSQLETANSYLMDFDDDISDFPSSVNKTEFHFIREDL